MRVSKSGSPTSRSERPVPRLSKQISRRERLEPLEEARVPGVLASDLEVRVRTRGTSTRLNGPSPVTWYAMLTSPLLRVPDRGCPCAAGSHACGRAWGSAREGGEPAAGDPPGDPALRKSGCPDSNWGYLRPERSALPGCATPRAGQGSRFRAPAVRARAVDSARMAPRDGIVGYANELLEVERFPEFAPPGAPGRRRRRGRRRSPAASPCSRELFERAAELGARARARPPRPLLAQRAARRRRAPARPARGALPRRLARRLPPRARRASRPSATTRSSRRARRRCAIGQFGAVGRGGRLGRARRLDEPRRARRRASSSRAAARVRGGGEREIDDSRSRPAPPATTSSQAAHEGYDALPDRRGRRSRAPRPPASSGST